MKETKIKTSLLSLTLEPRNTSLVHSIIILLSEKTRTQNKRWAGFNDNLDFDDSSHEHPELSVPRNYMNEAEQRNHKLNTQNEAEHAGETMIWLESVTEEVSRNAQPGTCVDILLRC